MKIKRIRLGLALAALSLLLAGSVGVSADPGYTGEVDPETGQPYAQDDDQQVQDTGRVQLTDNCEYDWYSHDFVFTVPGTLSEVHSGASDGMILSRTVSITASVDTSLVVYRNGEEYTESLIGLSTPGDYVVQVRQGSDRYRLFTFTLVGSTTNGLKPFSVPDSYYIVSATRDGVDVPFDRYTVDTNADGAYKISYECIPTGLTYSVETLVDRTAPSLTFSGKFEDEYSVRSRLTFEGLQQGDTMQVLNGETPYTPTIKEDGSGSISEVGFYTIRVYDTAGNMTEYHYRILTYLNINSWAALAMAAAVVAVVAGYVIMKRRKLRIG